MQFVIKMTETLNIYILHTKANQKWQFPVTYTNRYCLRLKYTPIFVTTSNFNTIATMSPPSRAIIFVVTNNTITF